MRGILTAFAVLFLLGEFALFGMFLLDSRRLGGDALNGSQEGARTWVSDHGRRTEVTAEEFRRNRRLGIAAFSLLPLGLAGTGYLLVTRLFPRGIYLRGANEAGDGADRVRRSGAPLAEARAGGRLGWVDFGGPFLRLSVHPGGLVVKPIWMPAFGIRREDIRAVRRVRSPFGDRIEIEHASPDVRSPLRFTGKTGDAFVADLEGLAARAR